MRKIWSVIPKNVLTPPNSDLVTNIEILKDEIRVAGCWNAQHLDGIEPQIDKMDLSVLNVKPPSNINLNCANLTCLDTAGALILQKIIGQLSGFSVTLKDLNPQLNALFESIKAQSADNKLAPVNLSISPSRFHLFESVGQHTVELLIQIKQVFVFIGETAQAFTRILNQPQRIRWRPILFNIHLAGFNALPIVGLLSFLLGIVVAYQGADQLRQYGANIFVADLIGLSILREFSPLMTAIIIAGRSGSAYAAQIGTMAVTEEIDAMRTLGISPQELLVLPKIIALIISMPLLTVFADISGVFGGMLMARQQLDVGFVEFLDRFVKAVDLTALMVGIGKAPVFAAIIATVGCYQGFRTKGGADSVGRQTTRSVVQSIFFVIVADALFSIAFSILDL